MARASAEAGAIRRIDEGITTSVASGGLTVYVEERPWQKSVAMGFFLPYGTVNESPRENGAAHFIEHLVFKGTGRRSAREIAIAVEQYGGQLNAATERELTNYYCKIAADYLPRAMDVLADLCFNAVFKPSLVDRERMVVQEEIEGNLDDPLYFLFDQFLEDIWGNNRLSRPITGSVKSLERIDRDTVWRLYKEHYRPEHMILSVVGGTTHQAVLEAWETIAARFKFKKNALAQKLEIPKLNPKTKPGLHIYPRPVEQASIILGFPGIHIGAPERHLMACLDGVLGGGMGGILFQSLRERRGLVYDVTTSHLPYRATGLYAIEAGCNPERLYKVVEAILTECARLRAKGITKPVLRHVQEFLAGSFALSMESSSNRMYRLGLGQMYLKRHESEDEVLANVRAVRAEQVNAFGKRLLNPRALTVTVVVPEGWEEPGQVREKLLRILRHT